MSNRRRKPGNGDSTAAILQMQDAATEADLDAAATKARQILDQKDWPHVQAWCDYHRPRIRARKAADDLRATARDLRTRPMRIVDLMPVLCRAADCIDALLNTTDKDLKR